MLFLNEILNLLQEVFTTNTMPGVNFALGPLAVAGIAIGAQVVGQGLSHLLGSKDHRRQRRRERRAENRMTDALGDFREGIGGLRDQSRDAFLEAQRSDEELFGEELERRTQETRDAVNQQTAGARQAVSRSLLAGGGDVTGAGGVTLNRLQQQANTSISDALSQIQTEIARRGQSERRFQLGRADRLSSAALAGESNLFGALSGQAQNAELLRIQQQQAQRQLGVDVGSGVSTILAESL